MKVVGLISGGKDSCYAMMRCIDFGHEIVALANLLPLDDATDELDSFMYQTVGHQVVVAYAQCMGLPLYRRRIQGMARAQELRYAQTENDEVEDLFLLLKAVQSDFPTLGGVSCGAIASDYQRMRVENVCSRLGLVSLAFLWKQEQAALLQQMIDHGIAAVIVKVAAMGLSPHAHLGKSIAEMQPVLTRLNSLYGINICGEGGEYESLTFDCGLFKDYRIVLDAFEIVQFSPSTIAPVGVLHPSKFHMEPKLETASSSMQPPCVKDVEATFEERPVPQKEADTFKMRGQHLFQPKTKLECTFSAQNHGNFAIYTCWTKSNANVYGIEDELGFVLTSVEDELKGDNLSWADVLYIHLYIDDMGAFALANQTYMDVITEEICARGVPSRSTVGIALLENNLGRIMVEAVIAKGINKKVLHVQSISCWAPSCIGPYSQATACHDMLYMAGQLGLDPPTMALVPGGAAAEMKQALRNCEAVAQAFSASLVHCSVSIIVYCSVVIPERKEAEKLLKGFLCPTEEEMEGQASWVLSVPIIYVQVPALPKGAALEIEPFLYLPSLTDSPSRESSGLSRVKKGERCHGTFVSEHLLRAFFSIPQKIQPESKCISSLSAGSDDETLQLLSEELGVCIQLFSELLAESSFNWENVLALRILFVSEAVSYLKAMESWKNTVEKALSSTSPSLSLTSLNSTSGLRCLEPLFLPVLRTGMDMNMEDLITVDLLAFS